MSTQSDRALHIYLWVLMAGLLFQGVGSLIFRLVPALPASMPLLVRGAFGIDFWHAWIHIGWGLIGLVVLSATQTPERPIRLALIFGFFYTSLGIWGVLAHHPLGLELDLPENLFHLIAGPAALLLGLLALVEPRLRRTVIHKGAGRNTK
jgi:hypothetical protein